MKNKIAIIFCVEKGVLEAQAKLLIASINSFLINPDYQLIAVSPRNESRPVRQTELYFKDKNVLHIKNNINRSE